MPFGIGRYMAHSFGMMGYGWLFEIMLLIVLFLIVYWIAKSSIMQESAEDILKRRYVNGEISKKEFEQLRKDIA